MRASRRTTRHSPRALHISKAVGNGEILAGCRIIPALLVERVKWERRGWCEENVSDCCNDKACAIEALRARQSSTLRIVLVINAVLFVVEFASGLFARSTALLSDSLDNLGDATTYALSLYAVSRGARAKARVALFKGGVILIAALFVLGRVAYGLLHPGMPVFEAMGVVSLVALAANATCLALLWKHRCEDVNMGSVWECSRNDIASNVSVSSQPVPCGRAVPPGPIL